MVKLHVKLFESSDLKVLETAMNELIDNNDVHYTSVRGVAAGNGQIIYNATMQYVPKLQAQKVLQQQDAVGSKRSIRLPGSS